MIQTLKFPSSSSSAVYTVQYNPDTGDSSCDCPGWTFQRPGQPRGCKHTKKVAVAPPVDNKMPYLPPDPPLQVPGIKADPGPKPMLASADPDNLKGDAFNKRYATGWALEEKLDGHRIVVVINDHPLPGIRAWSRLGNERDLPAPMLDALGHLSPGIYDGELVSANGGISSDVTRIGEQLIFVIFDVLQIEGEDLTAETYAYRRAQLLYQLARLPEKQQSVSTVLSIEPPTWAAVEAIWAKGGEGAIIKKLTSPYVPNARCATWIKVKREGAAVGTITGFTKGKGGPYATTDVTLDNGVAISVKTLDNQTIRAITAAPNNYIGRRLVISHKGELASGKVRHPMWDHLES